MISILKDNMIVTKNEEKKCITVTAKVNDTCFNSFEEIPVCFVGEEKVFVGVARYKDGDADNEQEAIRIAESKMERAYYKYIRKSLKAQISLLKNYLSEFENKLSKTEKCILRADSHIKDICSRL